MWHEHTRIFRNRSQENYLAKMWNAFAVALISLRNFLYVSYYISYAHTNTINEKASSSPSPYTISVE